MSKRLFARRGQAGDAPAKRAPTVAAIARDVDDLITRTTHLYVGGLEPFARLRRHVAQQGDEAYAELLAWAERRRADVSAEARFILSFLFDARPELAERDLAESRSRISRLGPLGLAVARDPKLLADAGAPFIERDAPIVAYLALETARTLEATPDAAAAVLIAWAEELERVRKRLQGTQAAGDLVRCDFGDALACVGAPATAAWMAERVGSPGGRRLAARFFRRFPDLAQDALEPVRAARGRKRDAADALLADARARAGVTDAPAAATLPIAPPELVPAVLRDPPWHRWKASGLPIVEVEEMPAFDLPAEATRGLDREAWLARLPSVPRAVLFSSRAAFPVAHAWLQRRAERAAAEEWLRDFAPLAVFGLIPYALAEPGSSRTLATSALRFAWRVLEDERGATIVARWAREARVEPSAAMSAVRAVLAADPIWDCPARAPAWPGFLPEGMLPPVRTKDRAHAIDDDARRHLVELLAFAGQAAGGGDLVPPYRGVAEVREALDMDTLEDLVWTIYRAWVAQGSGARVTWPLDALALFGGARTARDLAQQARSFATERAYERAQSALEVLARVPSDTALVQLHRVAESGRTEGMRNRARALLADVAKERGLPPEELEDLLVPDLGLDERGAMTLDFGPRRFHVTFDANLAAVVRDDEGHVLERLPKPTKADDPERAAAAVAAWSGLRADAEGALRGQVRRLERAMCARRRWTRATFEERLVRHPLLRQLAMRLVWAATEPGATRTFRVAEDLSFADADDEPVALAEDAEIALPHPLEVPDALRAIWNQRFADYQVFSPFPQMAREVFALDAAELAQPATYGLSRHSGKVVRAGALFALEQRGWSRTYAAGRGECTKAFGPLTASLTLDGRGVGEDATLAGVMLRDSSRKLVAASRLDPIAASELLRDLWLMVQ